MKKLLILFIIGICGLALRSEELMQIISAGQTAGSSGKNSISELTSQSSNKTQGMSLLDYAKNAEKDPQAYQKLIQSHRQTEERSEVDKLMNFFARGKYE